MRLDIQKAFFQTHQSDAVYIPDVNDRDANAQKKVLNCISLRRLN